jgi:membrane protease YdiL (CAAX protease family)
MNMTVSMIAQHLLALFLIVGAPILDHYDMKKLKASTDPKLKLHFYHKTILALWLLTAVACAAVGFRPLFTISASAEGISWVSAGSWVRMVVVLVIGALLVLILLPAVRAIWNEKIRARFTKAIQFLNCIMPMTPNERRWFVPLCVTAGVCEEILCRGFLLHYLHTFPFHLELMFALLLSSAIFGMGHLYQGVAGVIQTAVMGFMFGLIFFLTSTLLVPIVLHALIDLRVLLLLQPGSLQGKTTNVQT